MRAKPQVADGRTAVDAATERPVAQARQGRFDRLQFGPISASALSVGIRERKKQFIATQC
jgi:hypothetical protein